MKKAITRFLRDEGGAVTVDSVAVIGGSVWMAVVVVGDISVATLDLTSDINERLEYASVLATILDDYGPDAQPVDCVGNPGNAKCVGNAGETPNGDEDAWGDEIRGQSQ